MSLLVAADHLAQESALLLDRHGITGDQYNVLRILRGAYPAGHSRMDVARRLVRRSPDVTRLLDRLVRRKLVARVRGPDDARLSIARITASGLTLLERIDPEMDELMRTVTAPLGEAQLRQLASLCDALVP